MAVKKSDAIENRLDNIEEILKMMLVNNVLSENEENRIQNDIINSAKKKLQPFEITNIRLNYIEKKYYLFIDVNENESLVSIKKKYADIISMFTDIEVVLSFEKIHPKRKKALIDAGLSCYFRTGELHIF